MRNLAALHHIDYVSLESLGVDFDENLKFKKKFVVKLMAEEYYTLRCKCTFTERLLEP